MRVAVACACAAIGLLVVAAAGLTTSPAADARRDTTRRLDQLLARASAAPPATLCAPADHPATGRLTRISALTASWQSIAGCGAGSSTGVGGIKWVGRNVTGGLFNLQCQTNYTKLTDGFVYSVLNQITTEVNDRWGIGVSVPYLYKLARDPFGIGFDISNKGLGDVNVLLLRRFGAIRATTVTASIGLPTGTSAAQYQGNYLGQDQQLGVGTPNAALLLDHVFDNLWGPAVLGGSLVYPGETNSIENYRAPSGSVYGYVGYLLGPLVPAVGVSATGYYGADRDRGFPSDARPPGWSPRTPRSNGPANGSP